MRFTKPGRLGAVLVPLGLLIVGCSRQPTAPSAVAPLGSSSATAVAATSTVYLHGSGVIANPSVLSLDDLSPSASTARYKDSPSVRFAGGNAWVEIGRWSAAPAFSRGSLTSLGDVQLWLGLKNSDDIGTNFDVRAEVYAGSAIVASGESHCISGITRNPDLAKAVGIAFGPFSPVAFDGSTQALSLRLLARIGTNASGGPCGGHASATGLRTYFDATSRPASFSAAFAQGAHVSITMVEDATGAPVAGATVTLIYAGEAPAPKEPPGGGKFGPSGDPNTFSGVTDANGFVEFADQRVGVPAQITAGDEFGRLAKAKISGFAAGDNSVLLRATAATQGILRGVVTSQGTGAPVRGCGISVGDASGVKVAVVFSADDGSFSTEALPAGTYLLEFSGSGHEPLRIEGVVVIAGQSTVQNAALVELPPPPPLATITVTVVDADGNRVAGAVIHVDLANGTSTDQQTDSVGNALSFDLTPQLITVTATAPNGATGSTTVDLQAGSTSVTITVQ